jgi:undecaprenyl diphosphate synthase
MTPENLPPIDLSRLPRHVAIIMDGNGRWAKQHKLKVALGHRAGTETLREIIRHSSDLGIEALTLYAFSTENWSRPEDEVGTIMKLLKKYLNEAIDTMERDRMKMKVFGDVSGLPESLQTLVAQTNEISRRYEGFQANICLNYGGRAEIARAARLLAQECAEGKLQPEDITEAAISRKLYSADIPDPDLMIRPGGELRLSNFLLWQNAYTEFYFTDTLWPDMDEVELDRAIAAYQSRKRRYGGI